MHQQRKPITVLTSRVPPGRLATAAFTLIELSIVLVIIGLIVGGVLVGQSLIAAAGVRATISQIEKYNTAVNTFRDKYGGLPGDISAGSAAQFGFAARVASLGQGDGNGVIQGYDPWSPPGSDTGCISASGEAGMFWEDLTAANGLNVNLIDGSFNQASMTSLASNNVGNYFPTAKLGQGNYIYVWSGGPGTWGGGSGNGTNYFGLSVVTGTVSGTGIFSTPGLSVTQAYSIDKKIDDGLPMSGNITAVYNTWSAPSGCYGTAAGGGGFGNPYNTATPGSATTCYDNGNVSQAVQQYSLAQNTSNLNCALTFQFQ
jgi:prepilin-type N-terminal cleavage/methylation domain-containing protein